MSQWTIKFFKSIDPEVRLIWAARLFWFSIFAGILSTIFISKTSFEKILMAISWAAVTVTCYDVMSTADVRSEEN